MGNDLGGLDAEVGVHWHAQSVVGEHDGEQLIFEVWVGDNQAWYSELFEDHPGGTETEVVVDAVPQLAGEFVKVGV